MAKVKLLKPIGGYKAGDVIDVSDKKAKYLIAMQAARLTRAAKAEPEEEEPPKEKKEQKPIKEKKEISAPQKKRKIKKPGS